MDLYNDLFGLLSLSAEHRQSLKEKRGFTDETIDRCGFKSASADGELAINALEEKYGHEHLIQHGLLSDKGATVNMVLEDKILIPFKKGSDITYFRAHRNGLKGIVPPLYIPPKTVPTE